MEIGKIRDFLLEKGMARLYALFLLGYFALPMSGTLQKFFYFCVLPATLLLSRELLGFYRGNRLFTLFAAFNAYMLCTLLWTENFDAGEALEIIWYSLNQFLFVCISGYLWIRHPESVGKALQLLLWLAGIAAVASVGMWYWDNPFPTSRVEPLGVIHHPNKAACVYALLLLMLSQYLFSERSRGQRLLYWPLCLILAAMLLLTQSRTGLAAAAVGAIVLFGYRALGAVAVGGAISWALLATDPGQWWGRVKQWSHRPEIWSEVLGGLEQKWIFGRGILVDDVVQGVRYVHSHAHNSYLATLRDGGMVGLLLFGTMLLLALYWALVLYRKHTERLYLAMVLLGMTCILLDFDRLFTKPKEQWLFFWLPVALVMAVYPHRQTLGREKHGIYSA